MNYLTPPTITTSGTTANDSGITFSENVYIFPPLRVFPNLGGLLWARELKLYLDWCRPKREENPCECARCTQQGEDEEDEYWDTVLCDGCDGMRRVATPCPRCDSATYQPSYPGAARKGPPTGLGPYKGTEYRVSVREKIYNWAFYNFSATPIWPILRFSLSRL